MAARAWANATLADQPQVADDDALADASAAGLDAAAQAAIARWAIDRTGPAFCGVWPDNADAVAAFLAAASQWRTMIADRNGRIVTRFLGLDYAGAAIAWSARGIEPDSDLFDRLTVIEMAARDALNGETGVMLP
ncbi:Phage related hypothetical protein (DUF1799) [Hoeflea phototrophica DFL-43]|jgi:hypothetical protein|uniref:Uncharacterized protein n=1 Tax=Hoeflea phototrophica (strain DSM 17068 / NCIMB 14078 / DFL-43) TaxID=411684 RepID=A9D2Y9_HOEPD|nr:DUF1799 domain-containing protein [Hoeflea phototrophica]EDQ34299.1 Phage related hypothetical protein (DUF1799) [Hoeflea phototrophica DFL-43]